MASGKCNGKRQEGWEAGHGRRLFTQQFPLQAAGARSLSVLDMAGKGSRTLLSHTSGGTRELAGLPPDTLSVLGWLLTPLVCSASSCRLYCVWNKPLVRAAGTDSGQGCGTHRQDAHTAHSPSASPRAVPGWRPTLACRSSRDGSARTTTGSPASRRGSRCPGRSKPAPHPRLSVLSCRGASL